MSDRTHLVAIDDGYAQMKLFGATAEGTVRSVLRTSVRPGRDGLASISGAGSVNGYTTEEGEEYCISDRIAGENTQFDGFHVSPMNRALVHHSLIVGGYEGKSVDLVVGLPVRDYFLQSAANEAAIERKRQNLMRSVRRTLGADVEMARIADVQVGCQAVTAFIDFAYDDELNPRQAALRGDVAIVDVGGRTTDIALIVDGGRSIDFARSGTDNIGALDVYKALQGELAVAKQLRDPLSIAVLDKAVRENTIELYGREADVADLVKKSKADVQGKIVREIERRIGQAASLSHVVFVGGGAAMFPSIVEAYPHNGHVPEDPEIANARGLHKWGRTLALQAKAA